MIRTATTADRKAIYDMHTAKVNMEKTDSMEFYFARLLKIDQVVVNESDGHVVSSLQVNQHSMMLNDKRIAVGTIIGVCAAQGQQEYLKQLLDDVLDEQSRKNLVLTVK